ncbi:MAG: energy transducer TonB [Gemmatimonadota bacterium]
MADNDTHVYSTANRELHDSYGRYFKLFMAAAVVVHALLLVFFVAPRGEGFEAGIDELEVIDVPPEVKIPPPPEEIARPATPIIAEEPVEEDITIAETEITANEPVPEAPPPPPASEEPGDTFEFTTSTVKPKCTSGCTAEDILRHVPPMLKRSGVSCSLRMGIRIDTSGNVTATDLLKSSGNGACDQAAQEWAKTTRWSTAYNRDQAVVVWIDQPITIETQ